MAFRSKNWRSSDKLSGSLDHKLAIRNLFERLGERLPSAVDWEPVHCINPEHMDENASASVNPVRGAYACFACGLRGDAFKLLQQLEGLSFKEAKDILNPGDSDGSDGESESSGLVRRRDWL